MQPEFLDILTCLRNSDNIAEFCLQCPMYGITLDAKTVEDFTIAAMSDVVHNSIASKNEHNATDEYSLLTYQAAQQYCMFIRDTELLDAATSTIVIQHILNCFYEIYTGQKAPIATEHEYAQNRDAILALFFKSVEIRKPGVLKSLKTADKRNLLYLIMEYSGMSEYLHLMKEFVDGKLGISAASQDEDNCENSCNFNSYKVLKMTFGHTIRSLISCGVDPYETSDDGKSVVDLVLEPNFYKLIMEPYDGYLEAKEDKA